MLFTTMWRWLSRRRSAEVQPISVENPDTLEAAWSIARTESDPFRRDAAYKGLATTVIERYGDELLAFCEAQLGASRHLAEDVAQSALLTFWRVLPTFEGRSSLKTFLFGIAVNLCRRRQRDEARAQRLEDTNEDRIRGEVHPEDEPPVHDDAEREARAQALARALARLDARDAWVLRARYEQNLTYGQMLPAYQARFGDRISTAEGLRTLFFNAKKKLERKLGGLP